MPHTDVGILSDRMDEVAQSAMQQVVDLLSKYLPLTLVLGSDNKSFQSKPKTDNSPTGILSSEGKYTNNIIKIRMEIARTKGPLKVRAESLFRNLGNLGDRIKICPPILNADTGEIALCVELNVQATPMSLARSSAFGEEIRHLNELAMSMQCEMPAAIGFPELEKKYKDFAGMIVPVKPFKDISAKPGDTLSNWCQANIDLLTSGCVLAFESGYETTQRYALAWMAELYMQRNGSLGFVTQTSLNARALLEVHEKAPDVVVISAPTLSMGSSPYELGSEVQNLMKRISLSGKGMIICGTQSELQALFQGGQGATPNPLLPVVRHVPDIHLEPLLRHEIINSGERVGGISKAERIELFDRIYKTLSSRPEHEQMGLMPIIVQHEMKAHASGNASGIKLNTFVQTVNSFSETLSGISQNPRAKRLPHVSDRFIKGFSGNDLLAYLQSELLAQDKALELLVNRLQSECFTRPDFQPLCYCAQGTPATGKSASARLIAQHLGIPYINIDAASIPDFYTASAQLLGSGRGIVNSYQAGRLEQGAKHHTGVLFEISDLDHAKAQVRSAMADLFLQGLDNGEAQSATGGMFSLANCIFAFTINLPDGMDVNIRKSIGFGEGPDESQILKDVTSAVTELFSTAFMSRIGTPILFDPLNGEQVGEIVTRAIHAAAATAADRLDIPVTEINIQAGTGLQILDAMKQSYVTFGARRLMEMARQLTAKAMLELIKSGVPKDKIELLINTKNGKELSVQFNGKEK